MYISSRLSGQYLVQSLLEYWVHTLSRVLSVKPAPAVSLHSHHDCRAQYSTGQCTVEQRLY